MASFDQHSRCAHCRDKGHGNDTCLKKLPGEFCDLLTPEQVLELPTPTYKLRKERKQECESLVDPSSVTVLSSVDQDKSAGGFLFFKYVRRSLPTSAIFQIRSTRFG